ncbi:histidinol-phosphate transaminase [Salinarchaeum laminariae]|uniref:histidinol-phosphate transaminase n=1 Tax=Salinarchaeum laminariae TaxID=869888 RepID=UPI0020BE1822|nr:histidinol-phosphate transaminase [Salinarchaeum laminariae]
MEPRDLSSHAEYVPGEGIEEVARELGVDPDSLIKLASNENPLGPPDAAVDALREHADGISAYPTSAHADLTSSIADRWAIDDEQVWLSAGADGAIDLLHRATIDPGQSILAPEPGFAYYPMSARYHHGEVTHYNVPKDRDFAVTPDALLEAYDGERVVYLTSPHNPTGATVALDDVEEIADRTGEETLIVVDEAYGEFADVESARTLLEERTDVAVLRTFSKAYGLAGLRLGYALVPEKWADAYARINTPFAVSELACRAGLAAMETDDHVERSVEVVEWAREYMTAEIDAPTWESGGNFLLVEVGDATAVAEALKREGVIVRDCTSFGLPECIRITCGTEDQTAEAVEAVNDVLADLNRGDAESADEEAEAVTDQ